MLLVEYINRFFIAMYAANAESSAITPALRAPKTRNMKPVIPYTAIASLYLHKENNKIVIVMIFA